MRGCYPIPADKEEERERECVCVCVSECVWECEARRSDAVHLGPRGSNGTVASL